MWLSELVPSTHVQQDMFTRTQTSSKSIQLIKAMDSINHKMGKVAIKLASEGFSKPWRMKQENNTPAYTTRWLDIVKTT